MAEILVVEDDESVCALLETNLLIKGHEIAVARTGTECLELLAKKRPALVILDIMLPDADGFELLEHIRSQAETEQVPVLILTARGDERDRVRGLAAGADDYLVKPFYPTELLLRIDRLLNTKATSASLRKMALTDQLTGLGNRGFFETRLEQLRPRADREEIDLCFFVIDLPGITEQVRKQGWKAVDMVLAKLGAAISQALQEGEEGFWLGTQGVVMSQTIDSAAEAARRLDALKDIVGSTLENYRRQVPLIPYFGYFFYEAPESTVEILNKVARAPYEKAPSKSPKESSRDSTLSSVERAFGGKLTGLAPVDYVPTDAGTRSRAPSGQQKLDRRTAISQLSAALSSLSSEEARPSARASLESRSDPTSTAADGATTPSAGATTGSNTQPIPAVAGPTTLSLLDRNSISSSIAEMFADAQSEPHDLAICCGVFEGTDEAVARLGEKPVLSVLSRVASEIAAGSGVERVEGAKAFWDGRALYLVVPRIDVPQARELVKEMCSIAAGALQPHRLQLRVAFEAGYVFYDFQEDADSLIERAVESPRKGGVALTPLQARRREQAPE